MKQLTEIRRPVVLFDLDGTLLPMDYDRFEKAYFRGLCAAVPELPPDKLIAAVWGGTKAMMKNDGSRSNRKAFAEVFMAQSGIDYYASEERFLRFYETDFQKCAAVCDITDLSRKLVEILQAKGYLVAVATNPIFPEIATHSRLRWLGLDPAQFPLVTTFENSSFAKPNPDYYRDVCARLGVEPADCVMIGNDAEEDGCAAGLGMEMVLVTDCLLNRKNLPLDGFCACTLEDVLHWAESLPACK